MASGKTHSDTLRCIPWHWGSPKIEYSLLRIWACYDGLITILWHTTVKTTKTEKCLCILLKDLYPISNISFYCVHNQEIRFRFDILIFYGDIWGLFFAARWNPFELNIAVFEFFRFDLAINFDYLESCTANEH